MFYELSETMQSLKFIRDYFAFLGYFFCNGISLKALRGEIGWKGEWGLRRLHYRPYANSNKERDIFATSFH